MHESNVCKIVAARLEEIGINSMSDLRSIGAVEAYLRIQEKYPTTTTLYYLFSLEGAVLGIDYQTIPDSHKKELLEQLGHYK